jgi:hypothetical protein
MSGPVAPIRHLTDDAQRNNRVTKIYKFRRGRAACAATPLAGKSIFLSRRSVPVTVSPDAINAVAAPATVDPQTVTAADVADRLEVGSLAEYGDQLPTFIILLFGIIALVVFYLIIRGGHDKTENTRIYVIIVVVVGTLLVVTNQFTEAQTSAVIGFFGTVAGYLLGRSDMHSEAERLGRAQGGGQGAGQAGAGDGGDGNG